VQVVIEDYVHAPFIKVVSLVFCKFFHALAAAAALFAILKIAVGVPA
jgi:succinate dehydrogenase / fumarate reductase membrane anchor subunit